MGIYEAFIAQVEMIEAVPCAHYPEFVAACDRGLKPGGRVVMQVILVILLIVRIFILLR
jgi:cyclopropane fatty-acyl-phospholipid synthase-like methyltransferase